MTEQIGKIRSAYLGWEGHGILTCQLEMDFGGSGQSIGGYALDAPQHDDDGKFIARLGTAFGMDWLIGVMKACGVEQWNEVEGRTVLVLRESDEWNAPVLGIKPLPTEPGKPFVFADLAGRHFVADAVSA